MSVLESPLSESKASAPVQTQAMACGKTIIVGEHAVVHGAHAVAMPLHNLRIQVTFSPLKVYDPAQGLVRMTLGSKRASDHLSAVVEDAFRLLGTKPFPVEVEGHSSVLMGAGLGSSAALCVVLLRALSRSIGKKLSPAELARLANTLEARFHGTPSGLDASVVAHETLIFFRKGEEPEAFSPRGTWRFALIDSNMRSPTMAMIKVALPWFQGTASAERIARFDRLAHACKAALEGGDHELLASTMEESGMLLANVGVATPPLLEICQTARTCGALAAKITGAGGGGCVLTLLPHDPLAANRVVTGMREIFSASRVIETTLNNGGTST
jgi:mevalonate kinase